MWTPSDLIQATYMQRGARTELPYQGMRQRIFLPREVNLPLTFEIREYAEDNAEEEDTEEDQGRYQLNRGGGKQASSYEKERDPKQRMIGWANDKVTAHAPFLLGPTLNMLMRAESRTVTALLNSKNANQTKEIVAAAYRRAGLDSPLTDSARAAKTSVVTSAFETDFIKALHNQTVITQQIATTLQEIPKTEHHAKMDALMRDTQESYVTAVTALAKAVQKLEERVESWETTFLPQLIDRLPQALPPSPATTTPSEHEEEHEDKKRHVDRAAPYSPREPSRHEAPQEGVNALDRIRERSLRNCCERILSSQKQQETKQEQPMAQEAPVATETASALRPFRSKN